MEIEILDPDAKELLLLLAKQKRIRILNNELDETTMAEVVSLLKLGKKIQAVKLVRERLGFGLKEAVDYVDGLRLGVRTDNR